MSEWRTIQEAADELRIGKRTVEDMIAKGEMISVKIRRRRFIEPEEIARQKLIGQRRGRVS